jgi:catechol 2,3-dioxygenase-like lactoylglutathione lyase family enzyme
MTHARELRFAFIFDDYDAALHLFRDVFGLETLKDLDHQGGRGVILRVPSATLELFDREHGQLVDDVEVGRPLDDHARIAVNIDNLAEASRAVEASGAAPMADHVVTPMGRLQPAVPNGRRPQLTLFQSPS